MKLRGEYVLRKISDSTVVVPVGAAAIDFSGMINLNETGEFLFRRLLDGADFDELLTDMLSEYDVTREKAEDDIKKFLKKLRDADILE